MDAPSSDGLLLDLYACPSEPSRWSRVLDRLCEETGARSAVLQAYRFDGVRAHVHWSTQDTRTSGHQAMYAERISDHGNPRLDLRRAWRGLNRIARDEDLFDPGDAACGALQRQLATLGLGRFMGSLQQLGGDTFLGLALHRPVGDPTDFSEAQVRRVSTLAPHFGQSFELGARLQTTLTRDTRWRCHLDQLRCGFVMCDGAANVQWMNRSAQALMAANGTLRVLDGTLQARTHGATQALCREIAESVSGAQADTRRYIALGQGTHRLHVVIQALPPTEAGQSRGSAVLLAITDSNDFGAATPAAVAKLFGLTPSEAGVACAIVNGGTLEQYAQQRCVSIGTARGQLKQALSKTGARRQSELVRLVLSSPVMQLQAGGTKSRC